MSTHRARLIVATLAILLAATFAFAPAAHADRRSALSGNLLIKDTDDMFFFPHTALEHVRLVTFDLALGGDDPTSGTLPNDALGSTAHFGSAGLVFGSEATALGLFTHRSDTWGALVPAYYLGGDIDTLSGTSKQAGLDLWPVPNHNRPTGGEELLNPLQWIDLLAAFQLGASPLGFRLSVGHNRANSTTDADGDIFVNENTVWGVNAVVGYGLRGALNLDIGAEIGYGTQDWLSDQDGDPVDVSSATGFNFSAMVRGFSNMARGVDLGFTGLLFYRSYSSTVDYENGASDGSDSNLFGIDLGAGPLYHIDDKFNIAAHATLGFQRYFQDDSVETDAEDDVDAPGTYGGQFTTNSVIIPGLKISGEYRVFDWLWLRTGAQYFYDFRFSSYEPDQNTITDESLTLSGFRWVSGAGVVWQGLEMNGTFQAPFIFSGPNFIGGGSGMFGHLNVQYRF